MLKTSRFYNRPLSELSDTSQLLISTINAHCYNLAQKDPYYKEALLNSDILLPDGVGVIFANRWLTGKRLKKIAGADLFFYEMERLQKIGGKCFFLGSTEEILTKIRKKAAIEYPNIIIGTYSPPFRKEFNKNDNEAMIKVINEFHPDVLMIGMTAPKQEKWAYKFRNEINVGHICCIGAVFSFYAGTTKRAPQWMINCGLEWVFRLISEPRRLWRRYLIGNLIFLKYIIQEKKIN
jgi:N-acetylglucosaminyldiphosphoundecaprenol N-acetyl-beta-D-mannosaminyltransferase